MTHAERKCRFLERFQAVGCPVCQATLELRRSTWDEPERKVTALEAFQARHTYCLKTGKPPAQVESVSVETITPEQRKELTWKNGMRRFRDEFPAGDASTRSAA